MYSEIIKKNKLLRVLSEGYLFVISGFLIFIIYSSLTFQNQYS